MIQRIQSLFLLFAAVFSILLYFVLITQVTVADGMETITYFRICHVKQLDPNGGFLLSKAFILPAVLNLLLSFIPLVAIFLFRYRRWQSTLCRFLILLESALIVSILFSFEQISGVKSLFSGNIKNYLIILIPVLNIVLFFLAHRAILKDDKLIKSADRIR